MIAASSRRVAGLVAMLGIAIAGCGRGGAPVAELPPPAVTVSKPVVDQVLDRDTYEGRIAAEKSVEVRARVKGHLVKVNFEDGQLVKEGDLLFEIDPRPYKATLDGAEAQKASAEASLDLAKKEYARTIALAKTGAASREEVDVWIAKQATAAADKLKAVAAVEQAKLDLDFTKVTAPMSGRISRTQIDVGNLVNASGGETLLTTIVSLDPVYVYFNPDERSLLRYRREGRKNKGPEPPIKELKIPIEVALEGEDGYPHKGVIDFVDNKVNSSTGTIPVRGVLANSSGLFQDGLRARVRVAVGDPYKAILVTERAIGTEQGRKFVYVVSDQNVVQRRDVTLGRLSDGLQVVQTGLKPEEWVIVNGIQRVREGVKVQPQRVPMPDAEKHKPVTATTPK
jgi:RND family efflux transporter MFP subunit